MNLDNGVPSPLDDLCENLRNAPIPSPVEARLRAQLDAFRERINIRPASSQPRALPRPARRRFLAVVCGGLAASLVLGAALFHASSRDAWAQVSDAIRAKPWVRWALTGPNGERFEIWLSSPKRIAAVNTPEHQEVLQLDAQESMRFSKGGKEIEWRSMADYDGQEVARFESLFAALGKGTVTLPDSPVKIVSQTQKPVTEGDRRSIEFRLRFDDPRRTPHEYETTFHVDPVTHLPLDMIEEFPGAGKPVTRKFVFDYPEKGPSDIYALGVPKETPVVDRRQPRDARQLLARSIKARQEEPEPYSAFVLVSITGPEWKDAAEAYRVRRQGQRVDVEQADPEQLLRFRMRVAQKEIVLPQDGDRALWWKEQISEMSFHPIEVTKTSHVVPDQAGYPIFSVPGPETHVARDPSPSLGPAETVLVRVDYPKGPVPSNVFWISPAQSHLVRRWEMQTENVAKDWIHTTIIDRAEKSPRGRWYPVEFRRGAVEHTGDDLKTEVGVAPVGTQLYRSFIDFD